MSEATGFELSDTPSQKARLNTGNAGTEAAWFHAVREAQNLPVVARFTVLGEPVSKARARFTKKGSRVSAYTPARTMDAERMVAALFRQAAGPHEPDPVWTYGVVALFFNATRQRRDVDNMLKLVLDGLNGVAWADDDQVVEVTGRKSYDAAEQARTEVLVYRVGRVYRDTKRCEECGKEFPVFRSTRSQRFCSRPCAVINRARKRIRTCEQCGDSFDPGKVESAAQYCSMACKSAAGRVTLPCTHCGNEFSKQRCHVRQANYCSTACASAAQIARRKSRPAPATCPTCGGPLSKKTYTKCRACIAQATGVPRPASYLGEEVPPCPTTTTTAPRGATPAEE